ncbi:hypothetical protein R1flu_027948 [Riccia fluitans]|uniref:Uncharacterized protein n=1 Tax=Riccia fluitans TaxID=41844 RepID=A0ABD1XKE3_9MARC
MEQQRQQLEGWFHADVGLHQFIQHVCGFLDMLLLASGYQSDGKPAVWTSGTLQRALDWGCHIEEVLDSLPAGPRGQESKQTLNLHLEMVFENEPLPTGMTKVSSAELEKARSLLVQVLAQALPAEIAWLTASIIDAGEEVDLKEFVTRELSQRCMATGCVKSLQQASELAVESCVSRRQDAAVDADIWQLPQDPPECISQELEEWVTRGLRFISSAETIHKLSGAALIFSAGRTQWLKAFESLLSRPDCHLPSVRLEIAELCCFYLASPGWKTLPRKIALSSGSSFNGSAFSADCLGKVPATGSRNGERLIDESEEVEVYLRELLALEKDLWLQLHPILISVALAESLFLEEYIRYVGTMLDCSTGCPQKCTCDICRRYKDARERSWWLLRFHQHVGSDIQKRRMCLGAATGLVDRF